MIYIFVDIMMVDDDGDDDNDDDDDDGYSSLKARSSHGISVVGDSLYLFGGESYSSLLKS